MARIKVRCVGYEQLTSLATATSLASVPTGADAPSYAIIEPETAGIRYRGDGTKPTTSVGTPVEVGGSLTYDAQLDSDLQFIQVSAGAKLNVHYFQE